MSTSAPDRAAPQSDDEALTAQQMQQAEELLFSEPPREGFAKALFRGEFRGDILFPYPELPAVATGNRRERGGGRSGIRRSRTSTPRPSTARPTFPAR